MNTEEHNNLIDKIEKDKDWFEPFMKLVNDYYEDNPVGGSLHIVLGDGNLRDAHIDWCCGYACGVEDGDGHNIGRLMSFMKMKQRKRVWKELTTPNEQ